MSCKAIPVESKMVISSAEVRPDFRPRDQIETDSNYANIFSIWDRTFRTYTPTVDFSKLRYGLADFDIAKTQKIAALLAVPFFQ